MLEKKMTKSVYSSISFLVLSATFCVVYSARDEFRRSVLLRSPPACFIQYNNNKKNINENTGRDGISTVVASSHEILHSEKETATGFLPRTITTKTMLFSSSSQLLPSLLLEPDGKTPVEAAQLPERFKNKRVALYFGAGWCPMCTNFEPSLLQFREALANDDKIEGNLELIYVGSDRSEKDQAKRAQSMGMWSVPFGSDESARLKKEAGIWAGAEAMKFGVLGRRSGVPAILVLDNSGDEMAFIAAEAKGVRALQSWPLDGIHGIWRSDDEV